MENETDKGKKCTRCSQPVKGHSGPCGTRCVNFPTVGDDDTNLGDGDQPNAQAEQGMCGAMGEPTTNQILATLTAQMGQLNLTLENLVREQADTRQLVRNLRPQAGVAEAAGGGQDPPHGAAAPAQLHAAAIQPPLVDAGLQNVAAFAPDVLEQETVTLPAGAKITAKTRNAALRGEFVHLADFLQSIESPLSAEMEPVLINGAVSFRPKKQKKSIDSFTTWLAAWNNFEHLVVSHRPELYSQLVKYRQFIQSCDSKYAWHAVCVYDCRFRAKLAETLSFEYDAVYGDLYVTIFDATAIKRDAKVCHRCKSHQHLVHSCPFPAPNTVEEGKKTKEKSALHNGVEICNNFQQGRCRFGTNCRRVHVCRQCRGPEPSSSCGTCNK